MKRIILVFLLSMFVCPIVSAADYLETFVDYRWEMRRALGLDTTSSGVLDDTTANQFVRQAVFQIIPILRPRFIEDTIATAANDNTYSLDTLTIGISSVQWRTGDSVKSLIYAPRAIWYQLSVNPNLASEENPYNKRPSYYDYADSQIFLYPIPAIANDSFYIMSWYKLPTAYAGDSLFQIPVQYRVAVLRYAVYLVAQSRRHPLTEIYLRDYQTIVEVLRSAYPRAYQPQLHPDSGYFRSKY